MPRNPHRIINVSPAAESLPELCYVFIACHIPGQRISILKRGERGRYTTTLDSADLSVKDAKALTDAYNARLGVQAHHKAAMLHGSLFGFETAGANPSLYDPDTGARCSHANTALSS